MPIKNKVALESEKVKETAAVFQEAAAVYFIVALFVGFIERKS